MSGNMNGMNEDQLMIVETTERILSDLCHKKVVDEAEAGKFPSELWQAFTESGLSLASIDDAAGGSGGELADALLIARTAASYGAPIPLAETYLAASLIAAAGQNCLPVPMTVVSAYPGDALEMVEVGGGVQLRGETMPALFLSHCEQIVVVTTDAVCVVPREALLADATAENQPRLCGEAATSLILDQVVPGVAIFELEGAAETLLRLGAVMRSNQMAGAMTSVLAMSVEYALERQQFGRSLSKFQAIQQQLAQMAGEVAACQRAADSVLYSQTEEDVAIAKARIGEAVTLVADVSHQVHGAMGYTMEHGLNLRTRRLWDWRDDYGSEVFWQTKLAETVCPAGADKLWQWVTSRS